MELAFATRSLRTTCEDPSKAAATFGEDAAEKLRTRLADLRAVATLGDLPVALPEIVESSRPTLRFQLRDGWILVNRVNQRIVPRTVDGMLDIQRLRRIQVMEVTHE